jgi:hypothetical protein
MGQIGSIDDLARPGSLQPAITTDVLKLDTIADHDAAARARGSNSRSSLAVAVNRRPERDSGPALAYRSLTVLTEPAPASGPATRTSAASWRGDDPRPGKGDEPYDCEPYDEDEYEL